MYAAAGQVLCLLYLCGRRPSSQYTILPCHSHLGLVGRFDGLREGKVEGKAP